MTRRAAGDAHDRFHAWLIEADGADPPRDLALHASVCAGCAGRIAALDMLTDIDTGRAPVPLPRVARASRPLVLRVARLLGAATGVVILALVAGIGLGSTLQLPRASGGPPTLSLPIQEVLGGTGQPTSSPATPGSSATPAATPTTSVAASPSPRAALPSATNRAPTPAPTPSPLVTATPRATRTPRPTATASPSPTPTPTPSPTPSPSPTATASSSPTATPTPSPTPSPSPSPTPTPATSETPAPSPSPSPSPSP